jgi:hypothetical protein
MSQCPGVVGAGGCASDCASVDAPGGCENEFKAYFRCIATTSLLCHVDSIEAPACEIEGFAAAECVSG